MTGRVFMGRYKVIQLLGEGGMGKVYLALDVMARREAVVKVLHDKIATQASFREKFQQEMEFMARFQHPNVVALYDASINDPSGPCIVMEYIQGETLDTIMRQGRMAPIRVASFLLPLCKALFAAHQAGVIHRDLKPANLMVSHFNRANETLKVMDFGLSALATALFIPKERLANPSDYFSACGTPDYMCPEQIRGDELDHRSDLYSVGVILYQLLTGRLPFARATIQKVMLAQAEDKPPPFAQMGIRDVPAPIESVVMHCLSKYSVERPGTARDLVEQFEKALGLKLTKPEDWVLNSRPSAVHAPARASSAKIKAVDPSAIVHTMEAWMPERIAVVKLQGFVHDVGGQVMESVPGRILVKLGDGGGGNKGGGLALLSKLVLGRPSQDQRNLIELEMLMEKRETATSTKLHITAVYKPTGGRAMAMTPGWKQRCDQLHRELRAYLMGRE